MVLVDQVVIIDNNRNRAIQLQQLLVTSKIAEQVKIALNGDHGLLCLDHLDLINKLRGKRVMLILNLETPVANGFEFLEKFSRKHYPGKENILLLAFDDLSSMELKEKAKHRGIKSFIPTQVSLSTLEVTLRAHFIDSKNSKLRRPELKANSPVTLS